MTERNISLPDLILWTGTRVALGTGIGMSGSVCWLRLPGHTTQKRHSQEEAN